MAKLEIYELEVKDYYTSDMKYYYINIKLPLALQNNLEKHFIGCYENFDEQFSYLRYEDNDHENMILTDAKNILTRLLPANLNDIEKLKLIELELLSYKFLRIKVDRSKIRDHKIIFRQLVIEIKKIIAQWIEKSIPSLQDLCAFKNRQNLVETLDKILKLSGVNEEQIKTSKELFKRYTNCDIKCLKL